VVGTAYDTFQYTPSIADAEPETSPRTIPVLYFYPARGIGAGTLRKYIHENILPGAEGIETNSYLGAPIVEGEHPLLLFSHGMTLACELHTVQCEELASHGYIVVSIGHPGGGSYELPNGELIVFDMQKAEEEAEANSAAIEVFNQFAAWLGSVGKTAAPDEHYPHYQSVIDSQPAVMQRADLWIKDSLAAIDWILDQVVQPGTLLYNHVDTDKIGAFGMSFGGSTAMSISALSDVIKAAANLDGFFYSASWQLPLTKPMLLMNNDSSFGGFLRFPFLNAQGDTYLATVSETTHGSFIDYTEILAENEINKREVDGEEVELPLLGSIDPNRMETIMNTFLLDFFNKYLKGEPSRLIDTDDLPAEVVLLRKQKAAETVSARE